MARRALQQAAALLLLACCLHCAVAALREGPVRAQAAGASRRLTADTAASLAGEARDTAEAADAAEEAAAAAARTAEAAAQIEPFTGKLTEGASPAAAGAEAVGASAPDFRVGAIRRRRAKARRGPPRLLRPGGHAAQGNALRSAWDPAQASVAPPRSSGPWQACTHPHLDCFLPLQHCCLCNNARPGNIGCGKPTGADTVTACPVVQGAFFWSGHLLDFFYKLNSASTAGFAGRGHERREPGVLQLHLLHARLCRAGLRCRCVSA